MSNPANGTSGPFYLIAMSAHGKTLMSRQRSLQFQKTRRVATWSNQQLQDALEILEPDIVFLNFCNYLGVPGQKLIVLLADILSQVHGREVLLGYGAKNCDVKYLA